MAASWEGMFIWSGKIGPESLGDGRQDICKDKESNGDQLLATKAETIQS